MIQNNYCVIMAGGAGSRFWPLSTNECPKQFLDPMGTGKSFIRNTFERFLTTVPIANFIVVTSAIYKDKILEHIPELTESQVLLEPVRRNTAPCILYATKRIEAMCPNANIVVAPSDHIVTNEIQFVQVVKEGLEFVANSDKLLTIGIKPSRPETGYGYIQIDPESRENGINKVKTFTEKPNKELAQVFVDSGEFLWNSGIFIWSVKAIENAFKEFLPELHSQFNTEKQIFNTADEQKFIDQIYPECNNISIDYGIMEKTQNVYVRAADFGWSDVGTWGSVFTLMQKNELGNATIGNALEYNCKDTIIRMPEGQVAIVDGLEGYLVVQQGPNLIICKQENEQCIKNWVEDVKFKFGEQYT